MNNTLSFLIDRKRMEEAHQVNRANGWWEPMPAKAPLVLKIIEEVGEAISALANPKEAKNLPFSAIASPYFPNRYKELVKGTLQEEVADIVIRVWDYIIGFNIKFEPKKDEVPGFETSVSIEETVRFVFDYHKRKTKKKDGGKMTNLELTSFALSTISERANAIITALLVDDGVTPMGDSSYEQDNAFPAILAICGYLSELHGIDIEHHVLLKIAYNATRSHRHGNKKF